MKTLGLVLVLLCLCALAVSAKETGQTNVVSKATCKAAVVARKTAVKAVMVSCKKLKGAALKSCKVKARKLRETHNALVNRACAFSCAFQKHRKKVLLKKRKADCKMKPTRAQRKSCFAKLRLFRKTLRVSVKNACRAHHKKLRLSCYSAKCLLKREQGKTKRSCGQIRHAQKKKQCLKKAGRRLKRLILRVGKSCKRSNRVTCTKAKRTYAASVKLARAKCKKQSSSFARRLCFKKIQKVKPVWRKVMARDCKIARLRKKKRLTRRAAKIVQKSITHLVRYLKKMQKLSMRSKACKGGRKKYGTAKKLCMSTKNAGQRQKCMGQLKVMAKQLRNKVCGITKREKKRLQKLLKKRRARLRKLQRKLLLIKTASAKQRARLRLKALKAKLKRIKAISLRAALRKMRRQNAHRKTSVSKAAIRKLVVALKKRRAAAVARLKLKIHQNQCRVARSQLVVLKNRCNRAHGRSRTRCLKKKKRAISAAAIKCAGKCKRARIKSQQRLQKYQVKCAARSGSARVLCYRAYNAMSRAEYVKVKDACSSVAATSAKCLKSKALFAQRVTKATKRCRRRKGKSRHLCILWLVRFTQSEYAHMRLDCKSKFSAAALRSRSRVAKLAKLNHLYLSKLRVKVKQIHGALSRVSKSLRYFSSSRQKKLQARVNSIKAMLKALQKSAASAKHIKTLKQLRALGRTLRKGAARAGMAVRPLVKKVHQRMKRVKAQQRKRKMAAANAQVRAALKRMVFKRVHAMNTLIAKAKGHMKSFSKRRQAVASKQLAALGLKLQKLVTYVKAQLAKHKRKVPEHVMTVIRQKVKALGRHARRLARHLETEDAKIKAKALAAKKAILHAKQAKKSAALAKLYAQAATALKQHRDAVRKKAQTVANAKRIAGLNKKLRLMRVQARKHAKQARQAAARAKRLARQCRRARRKYVRRIRWRLRKCLARGGQSCKKVALLSVKHLKSC